MNGLESPGRQPWGGRQQRARKAIKDLRRQKTPITVSAAAARAGLTRAALYRRPELRALIRADQPLDAVADTPPEPGPASSPHCGPG